MVLDADSVCQQKPGNNTYVLAIFFEHRAEEYEIIRNTYEIHTKFNTKGLRTYTKNIRKTYETSKSNMKQYKTDKDRIHCGARTLQGPF